MAAIYGIVAILVITFSLSFATKQDVIEAERQADEYQEMVCLGRETSGEFGWPNFKNLEITCKEVLR
jgi:hypothetical protein